MAETNPAQTPAVNKAPRGARERIVVGCKLPNGVLIELRDSSGKVHVVKLEGFSAPQAPTHARPLPKHMIEGGYGLTSVDREMFEAWVADHPNFAPLKNGLIFSTKTENDTKREAKSRRDEKSGLEAVVAPKKTDKAQVVGPRVDED